MSLLLIGSYGSKQSPSLIILATTIATRITRTGWPAQEVHPRRKMNDHSQFGETSIIATAVDMIERIGLKVPRVAVEIGAGDGVFISNIRGLMEDGWDGYQFEREPSGNKEIKHLTVTAENINDLHGYLGRWADVKEIGVISIDIDGNDYWIWKAMTFNPCIVCIEYNPTLAGKWTIKYDPKHRWTERDNYFGASFEAMMNLGRNKGYTAIAKTEANLIFVRSDLWPGPVEALTHTPNPCWPVSDRGFEEV